MANAKRCDRCGGFYINNEKKFRHNGYVVDCVELESLERDFLARYDLCDECLEKLSRFLNGEELTIVTKDKNGETIKVGDIIKIIREDDVDLAFLVEHADCYSLIATRKDLWPRYEHRLDPYAPEKYEVIGNINDNPELLELHKEKGGIE